jgi:hypothetical protein
MWVRLGQEPYIVDEEGSRAEKCPAIFQKAQMSEFETCTAKIKNEK